MLFKSLLFKTRINVFRASALSLAIATLELAGCGGGSSASTATTTTTTATDTTTTATESTTTNSSQVLCSYAVNAFNSTISLQSIATWSCDSTTRHLTANGIPNHTVGTFPNSGNPNAISVQTVSASMPLNPIKSSETGISVKEPGFALDGVKFDPGTAGHCGSTLDSCSLNGGTGTWVIEALQSTFDFGVDNNNAHVQPGGVYHYHGMPELYLKEVFNASSSKMTLIGWAMDGFPMYARYGYSTATNASSVLKVMKGSYVLKTTPDSGRLSVADAPMGTFTQDYQYVAGSGDLDECNGRTDVTPEFPNGIYHYYLTDSYPYIPRCLKGTFTATASLPPPPPAM